MEQRRQGASAAALLCSPTSMDWEDLLSVLKGLEIEVASAASTDDAMDLLRGNSYALIVMDLDSDAEWKASLQALHSFAPATGVLAYSRRPEESLWLDVLDAGAFDLICRSSPRPEIQWIVENALKMSFHRTAAHPAASC